MRGLHIILKKIGFTTFSQIQDMFNLLTLIGCYETRNLQANLQQAGYSKSELTEIIGINHHFSLMDDIPEETEARLARWLIISINRFFQENSDCSSEDLKTITERLSNIVCAPKHLKYDVAVILGATQAELDKQNKLTQIFLKERNIKVGQLIVPEKPDETKTVLSNAIKLTSDLFKSIIENKSTPDFYKKLYLFAKTNRLLIISSAENLVTNAKSVYDFFKDQPSIFQPEVASAEKIILSAQEILEQTRKACVIHFSLNEMEGIKPGSTSYLPAVLGYGSTAASYAFSLFSYPASLGENVKTAAEPWLSFYLKKN